MRLGGAAIPLVIGGVIPPADRAELEAGGIAAIFPPGSNIEAMAAGAFRYFGGNVAMSHEDTGALATEAASIVAEFQFFSDWEERYQYLIAMGRKLPPVDDAICVETHRLYGCQSVVYFKADFCDGVMHYQATSDAAIVQGLIALILRV